MFLREDLEDSNVEVLHACKTLKEHQIIENFTVPNGFVKMFIPGERPQIFHPDQLYDMFTDFIDTYINPM